MEARSRIVLFKNDKGDNDKRPDVRGVISILRSDVEQLEYDENGIARLKYSMWGPETSESGTIYWAGPVEPKLSIPKQDGTQRIDNDDLPF